MVDILQSIEYVFDEYVGAAGESIHRSKWRRLPSRKLAGSTGG